jgi:hypothetical protein
VIAELAEPEGEGTLHALGQVEPPAPAVLAAAREALWQAVAEEMLPQGPAGGAGAAGTGAALAGEGATETGAGTAQAGGTDGPAGHRAGPGR